MSARLESIELQTRDLELLRDLLESRVSTLRMMTAVHFGGHAAAAKKRLQRLHQAGYVRQQPRLIKGPALYALTQKAFNVLRQHGMLEGFSHGSWQQALQHIHIPPTKLEHHLDILALCSAFKSARLPNELHRVLEFSTLEASFQFKAFDGAGYGAAAVLVKPDGYLRVMEIKNDRFIEHAFFLEMDRSTEAQRILVRKAICYVSYYRSGGYAQWLGQPREEFRKYPFRVLMVLKNAERRNNTMAQLLQLKPPVRAQVWLTTLEECLADPWGSIWAQPRDYLAIITGTAFDPMNQDGKGLYRHQAEREAFVERFLMKRPLMELP